MGNRAVLKPVDKRIGVYLHWNGGRDSVEAFLEYCKLRGFRDFGGKNADGYGIARFMQVVGNFFGGALSIGLETGVEMTDKYAEWIDNGIYEIDGWDIVKRCPENIEEQREHDLLEMLESIDAAQPQEDRLGKGFIRGEVIDTEKLKPGDTIWVYDENAYHKPKCRKHKIKGIEDEDRWNAGKLYYLEKSSFGKGYHRRYLTQPQYRLDTAK